MAHRRLADILANRVALFRRMMQSAVGWRKIIFRLPIHPSIGSLKTQITNYWLNTSTPLGGVNMNAPRDKLALVSTPPKLMLV